MTKTVADFFAGIGLVRFALEHKGWSTQFSVDYSDEKRMIYEGHFGVDHYHVADVRDLTTDDIPSVTLAHASFPCTDTSVAGGREGLMGTESGAVWEYIRVIDGMHHRRPPIVLLENVEGLLTSSQGNDLEALLSALCDLGYAVDLLLLDASRFVPQSRVRLFVIGVLDLPAQHGFEQEYILGSTADLRPEKIRRFIRKHASLRWNLRLLPRLPQRTQTLSSIIDPDEEWWSRDRTEYLFNQMHERDKTKVRQMMGEAEWSYGTVFRRMRNRDGRNQSTAELRTDGIAGCLRTPKGGSARQIVLRAGRGIYDARLFGKREVARLMGAENYHLQPELSINQVLFGFGDAVCVPVIEWLAEHYLNPVYEELSSERVLATSE